MNYRSPTLPTRYGHPPYSAHPLARRDAPPYTEIGQVATEPAVSPAIATVYGLLGSAGAAAGAYHGYKRHNDSIGWALIWAFLGALAPVITVPVAFAQGFGKPGR